MSACAEPIGNDRLLDYWVGELSGNETSALEAHVLGCGACSARLEELAEIAVGTRRLMAAGALRVALSAAVVERARANGLTVREYRVPLNGAVQCTVAPEDDLVVAYLEVPDGSAGCLDLLLEDIDEQGTGRLHDVPLDATSGTIAMSARIDYLKALGTSTARIRLLTVADDGERELGSYTFHHSPYPGSRN